MIDRVELILKRENGGKKRTYQDLATEYGVTRQRIYQILKREGKGLGRFTKDAYANAFKRTA